MVFASDSNFATCSESGTVAALAAPAHPASETAGIPIQSFVMRLVMLSILSWINCSPEIVHFLLHEGNESMSLLAREIYDPGMGAPRDPGLNPPNRCGRRLASRC